MATPAPLEYLADGKLSPAALRDRLDGALRLRAEARVRATGFYDTFDWRLYAAGWQLEIERLDNNGYRATCRARDNGGVHVQHLEVVPHRLADWPAGPVRDLLAGIAKLREPMLMVDLRGTRDHYSVLNQEDKIISRLCIDHWQVCGRSRKRRDVPESRVVLAPLKGWERETREAAAALTGKDLRPAARTLMERALEIGGRQPLDYSSKLRIDLQPEQAAGAALRQILLALLDTMKANEAGIKQDIDTEFLHDFRVAVRRTRSALSQVKGVLAPQSIAGFRAELTWLGRATGPKRDLDVHLLELDAQKALLSGELRDDLEPLRGFLESRRAAAGEELNEVLASERYRRLMREWRQFLKAGRRADAGPKAGHPVKDVADRRIWKLYRRAIKEGRAIDADSPPEDLHELRKTCKKLRYLMEFFRSLYAEEQIGATIKQLKRLQDNLGDFQDQTVQMAALREHAGAMSRDAGEPQTLLAMGGLIERVADQHVQTRAELAGRFQRFARSRNRKRFAALFKPG